MDQAEADRRQLIVQDADPLNAETVGAALVADFLTAPDSFYIRSHGAVPALPADHAIAVTGLVARAGEWTRTMLEEALGARTLTATMQCAGNRRGHMQSVRATKGDPWGVGAIGTARWTGVSLADLLHHVGIDRERARHVRLLCADEVDVAGEVGPYGCSIPIEKALDPDTLIAWAMNGEDLRPEHGAPLRAMVPGFAGVRSAKWLVGIEVADSPAPQPIQARDYKLFAPDVRAADADWAAGLTIDAMPLNSAICVPADGAEITAGRVTLRGYAICGERVVARVDVSTDGGASWRRAEVTRATDSPWAWALWKLEADLALGAHELVVRAVDAAGQMQPEDPEHVWNFGGYLAAHWHRVTVRAG